MPTSETWVAVCQYPNKARFRFYSDEFTADWKDLEARAKAQVEKQWAKLSPHPPPDVVDYLPGRLLYVPHHDKEKRSVK